MDSEEKPPAETSGFDWVSHHESAQPDVPVDPMIALVRRVGGELSTIDNQSVSSSTKKALNIDNNKLIQDLQLTNKSPAPSNHPPVIPQHNNPSRPLLKQPPTPQGNTHHMNSDMYDKLNKRITRLESTTKSISKSRKIKRGTSYKVSSNSMNGIIKDAEMIAEFVIMELSKGARSITIKLNESTDT